MNVNDENSKKITGLGYQNAYLLSSEYSTYLSGRYVEIKMLPLSFKDFLSFHGYEIQRNKTKKCFISHKAMKNSEHRQITLSK